ncbi:MAG: lamin tail domain-containing protein [Candidatus Nealsonbacteria bacterium]|nr:lamin tail domain-containing protein [Candidatus Nealsonbacteria bacterium]
MTRFTAGDDNSGPRLGSVIISEVHYNPGAMAEAADLEFVEIYNTTSQPVVLTNWRLRKAVSFDFAAGDVLGPHETIVVVGYDPIADPAAAAHFENAYNTPGSIEIRGPYGGKLDDDGERVQLQRPDEPPTDKPGFFPGLLEDEVVYDDRHGWPADADGQGKSLDRRAAVVWGNLPTHWTAETPSPGDTEFSTEVVGRYVFYNHSTFDGNDAAANSADDDAIATDKTALLPGQVATAANYTSYSRGINGIMIDLANLPDGVVPTVADLQFRIGNDDTPHDWTPVTPDAVHVRTAMDRGNADSVTVLFEDNAVTNTWLEVTVLATRLGLSGDDVFYLGTAVAETGNFITDARVTTADLLLTRNNPRDLATSPASVTFPYDFDRDMCVNATDVLLARNNQTNFLNALELIDLTGEAEQAQSSPLVELVWLAELDQPPTQRPAEKDDVAEAVDKLLAGYWAGE